MIIIIIIIIVIIIIIITIARKTVVDLMRTSIAYNPRNFELVKCIYGIMTAAWMDHINKQTIKIFGTTAFQ